MPLLGAEALVASLSQYRIAYIMGRFGGGKTSLAVALAKIYASRGYRVLATIGLEFGDKWDEVDYEPGKGVHAVLILDEGGLWFRTNAQFSSISAYAAKLDLIVLIPSVVAPHESFQSLVVQPVWSLDGVGIPYTHYVWSVNMGMARVRSKFGWLLPREVYGLYARLDPSMPDDVLPAMERWTQAFRRHYSRTPDEETLVPTTFAGNAGDDVSHTRRDDVNDGTRMEGGSHHLWHR